MTSVRKSYTFQSLLKNIALLPAEKFGNINFPHKKINQCLTDINPCLTDINRCLTDPNKLLFFSFGKYGKGSLCIA